MGMVQLLSNLIVLRASKRKPAGYHLLIDNDDFDPFG